MEETLQTESIQENITIENNQEQITENTIKEKNSSPSDDKDTITLTTGVIVSTDFTRIKGRDLMKARQATGGGQSTVAFILAAACLFDGEKVAGEDILDLDFVDYALLEAAWSDYNEKKLSQRQKA